MHEPSALTTIQHWMTDESKAAQFVAATFGTARMDPAKPPDLESQLREIKRRLTVLIPPSAYDIPESRGLSRIKNSLASITSQMGAEPRGESMLVVVYSAGSTPKRAYTCYQIDSARFRTIFSRDLGAFGETLLLSSDGKWGAEISDSGFMVRCLNDHFTRER